MKRCILPTPFFVFLLLSAMAVALPMAAAAAAVVEHTFVVSQVSMTHLCEETLVTVVNGQLPGPVIEVTEGDSVAVHVINKSPYNMTIHWHGVKQRMNCWADGVPMITQCPIRPNHSFTYRFNVAGQEGTLWWHAHVSCLRGSVHGAFIIRPRHGASSYPFPKPHREVPLVIGEWWQTDLGQIDKSLTNGFFGFNPSSATINGKLGDLNNCSDGLVEEGYVLEVEAGRTYLLRLINAALMSEYYFKIAGHKFTVVAADANYVKPYTTDVIAIAPGETVDALLVAEAAPERSYYMVALANQPSLANPRFPVTVTRGTLQYLNDDDDPAAGAGNVSPPLAPEMPGLHDMVPSFYFHGNLTSLRPHPRGRRTRTVPVHVDERLLVTLSTGSICRNGGESCERGGSIESIIVATMNNVSFQLPATATTLLAAHYNHSHNGGAGELSYMPLPERPPWPFNFTDRAFIPIGPTEAEAWLEPTRKATTGRRFPYGAAVEVVFQNTAVMQSDSNPMHLHGHDMFVVAQGHGDFDDAARAKYNLVDPPVRNTVLVPSLGWAVVRFVADNPGVWYLHCHYEFHVAVGMATVFVTEDGPTVSSTLPPPPADLPNCGGHGSSLDVMENDPLYTDNMVL